MTTPILLAPWATAAGATTHEVELAAGAQAVVRQDTLLSPRAYKGALPAVGLGWSARADRSVTEVDLSLGMGALRSGPQWTFFKNGDERSADASPLTQFDLQVAYGRTVVDDGWTLQVGGTLANHVEDIDTVYGFIGVKTYMGAFELGPWVDLRVPVGQRFGIEAQAWVPVAT